MKIWKRNLMVCWFGVLATSAGLSQLTPILPLYIEQLGVRSLPEIEQWSGFIYGVTFICMAIFSPLWGRAADQYGRKPMLLRASLGMAIIISGMAFVQNVFQLAGRITFIAGNDFRILLGGYHTCRHANSERTFRLGVRNSVNRSSFRDAVRSAAGRIPGYGHGNSQCFYCHRYFIIYCLFSISVFC